MLAALESRVLLSALPLESTTAEAAVAASSRTQGAKSVLVIRVDFSDAVGAAVSEANVLSRMSQANAILSDFSYGQFSIPNVAVTPVLRMPHSYAYYNQSETRASEIQQDARALAEGAGYSINSYWTDIYSFRNMTNYGWIGLAELGSSGLWLNGDFTVNTAVHEIGHNLGAGHGSFWNASTTNPVGSGNLIEYGDPYDTMGNGESDFGAYYKHQFDWIGDAQVQTGAGNGVQRIYAIDYGSTLPNNIYALKVPAGSKTYWLEYRADQTATANGVRFTWEPTYALNDNVALLDMTPNSNASAFDDAKDATLNLGQSFLDPATGYTFTVTSRSSLMETPWIEVSYLKGPEVAVKGNNVEITDGDASPTALDWTNFGPQTQGTAGTERVFTIVNSGLSTLTIGSISVPTGFTLTESPASSLAAGALTTFKVKINTDFAGTKAGTITFATNDADEGIYSFSITGTVAASSTPTGYVDALSLTKFTGWAYDPDSPGTSVEMRVRIDGVAQPSFTTTTVRSDVNAAFSLTGSHGFSFDVPGNLAAGLRTFSAYALDTSTGAETFIGSKTLTVPESGSKPTGYVDAVVGNRLVGWVYDPDTSSSAVTIKVQVDGGLTFTTTTNVSRPDVNTAFNITGVHGFSFEIPSNYLEGFHVLTVSAVDTTHGTLQTIGSKTISQANLPPKGYIDAATANVIQGWAYDPSATTTSIGMVYKVNGVTVGTGTANTARSDVNAAFGLTGAHGFQFNLPTALSPGTHFVEAYGVDTTSGVEHLVASRSVTVTSAPTGYLEFASASVLYGWAYDADAPSQPISVRVEIDGVTYTTLSTNVLRNDVNAAFGILGTHGFMMAMPTLAAGSHSIAVRAIDINNGSTVLLGVKNVVV